MDTSKKRIIHYAFDDFAHNENAFYSFESTDIPAVRALIKDKDEDSTLKRYERNYVVDYTQEKESTVVMEFDTKNMTMKYYVNGEDQGIAFEEMQMLEVKDVEYVAEISVDKDVSIQLLRFAQEVS